MDEHAPLAKVYLLMDCNNFFVSCERIFRPDLEGRPVIVLSNNDGCVVARSAEVKALGIKMGEPVFKIMDLIKREHIVCFSSNFNLYLDISSRIMRLLDALAPEVLVYSVDEAFVVLRNVSAQSAYSTACRIKKTVERAVGVPVSLGAATSKTLAKIASHHAKTRPELGGVCALFDELKIKRVLSLYPIGEIWGIGRRLTQRLENEGYHNAAQLAAADGAALKKRYSVMLQRTILELNGRDVIEELAAGHVQQQIMWSRSFRERLKSEQELSAALCGFAALAGRRLRERHLFCRLISVHIRTSCFTQDRQYQAEQSLTLDCPTSDSRILLSAVNFLLHKIYRPGYAYAKAGIVLSDLSLSRLHQGSLFAREQSAEELKKADSLMEILDSSKALYLGAQLNAQGLKSSRDKRLLSPAYTTSFTQLPELT